jgi:hypothetical protein
MKLRDPRKLNKKSVLCKPRIEVLLARAYTLSLFEFNAGVLANCCRVRKTLTPVQIMLFAGSVSLAFLLVGGRVE